MGGTFPDYSRISEFRYLSESNKNGSEMDCECEFSPFRIQPLTRFHPWRPVVRLFLDFMTHRLQFSASHAGNLLCLCLADSASSQIHLCPYAAFTLNNKMHLWWVLCTLCLLACQVELPWRIQVSVVVSLVYWALLTPLVCSLYPGWITGLVIDLVGLVAWSCVQSVVFSSYARGGGGEGGRVARLLGLTTWITVLLLYPPRGSDRLTG